MHTFIIRIAKTTMKILLCLYKLHFGLKTYACLLVKYVSRRKIRYIIKFHVFSQNNVYITNKICSNNDYPHNKLRRRHSMACFLEDQ
jgi:hypothetical protein